MGFFFNGAKSSAKKSSSVKKHIPIQTLNEIGCKACSFDKLNDLESPKLEANGSERPSIYVLGDFTTEKEDLHGKAFTEKSQSGKFLRDFIGSTHIKNVRFHNTVRCAGGVPQLAEIECCRGYVVKDIEDSKPLIVVAVGNAALHWATNLDGGVNRWRGKLIATKIGKHSCWVYAIYDPRFVIEMMEGRKFGKSEFEVVYAHDWTNIFDFSTEVEAPKIYEAPYDKGIICLSGESSTDYNKLEDLLNELKKEETAGIDLETTRLRPYFNDSKIVTCAIGTFNKTVAFALDHPNAGWSVSALKKVYGLLGDYLLDSGRKIAHNLAFEMEWLAHHYGTKILRSTEWEDTQAQTHTLDETPGTNSLDSVTRQYFGFFLKDQSRVDAARIMEFSLPDVLRYNGMDSKWTHLAFNTMRPIIEATPEFKFEYERKLKLVPTLVKSQLKGVPVDLEYALKMQTMLNDEFKNIETKVNATKEGKEYTKRFGKININSPDDVLKLMNEVCKREEIKKPKGGFTSGEEALNKMPPKEVPSAPLILKYRTVSKICSTYMDPIISRKIVGNDNKLHTQYRSMVAVTGRLSSEDPALQNYPKRQYKEVRGVIASEDGEWIVPIDYGQIEARVAAMVSEDETLTKYLWTGYDIHQAWAIRFIEEYPKIQDWIFSEFEEDFKPGEDVDKKIIKLLRQEAKNKWVFPQFFGSHYTSCARDMHVPDDVAKKLSKEFWDEFSGVLKWQNKLLKKYEKTLYVETLNGRRRRGAMTKNEIINSPIQGTACDIVTEAMNALSLLADIEEDEDYQPNLNVHDDLTFFLSDDAIENKIKVIAKEMCMHRFDWINVPLIVEVSIGSRWHETKEYAVYKSSEIFNLRNPYK